MSCMLADRVALSRSAAPAPVVMPPPCVAAIVTVKELDGPRATAVRAPDPAVDVKVKVLAALKTALGVVRIWTGGENGNEPVVDPVTMPDTKYWLVAPGDHE